MSLLSRLLNANFDGTIKEGDVVIFFNYRNDRAKELTVVLIQQDMPEFGMHTIPNLQYYCMTPYDASFKGVHILFDKENVVNTLGEFLASKGLQAASYCRNGKICTCNILL